MVSWLFLALAIFGSCWTLLSFHPPHRPEWLMMAGFFGAWLTTELAPIHLLWSLAAVIVFIALGALDSLPGWIALALMIASWAALVWSLQHSLQTDRSFRTAFAEVVTSDPERATTPTTISWGR